MKTVENPDTGTRNLRVMGITNRGFKQGKERSVIQGWMERKNKALLGRNPGNNAHSRERINVIGTPLCIPLNEKRKAQK